MGTNPSASTPGQIIFLIVHFKAGLEIVFEYLMSNVTRTFSLQQAERSLGIWLHDK